MSSNNITFDTKIVDGEYITVIRSKTPVSISSTNDDQKNTITFSVQTDYPFTFQYHKRPMSRL